MILMRDDREIDFHDKDLIRNAMTKKIYVEDKDLRLTHESQRSKQPMSHQRHSEIDTHETLTEI